MRNKRYLCSCDPTILNPENEVWRYAQMVLLELPEGPERSRRIREGLSSKVCLDPCITDVIKDLWSKGIETLGCCCGHHILPGYVDVHPDHHEKMLQMGYERMPVNEHGHGQWSFLL